MNKATYVVPQKTKSADLFDARPQLGTGGQKLKALREAAPGHTDIIDAVWHLASHMNGVAITMEKEMGIVKYAEVNPSSPWGRATVHARETMAKTLDPKRIIATKQV
jgi:hypothetical protein